MQPAISVVVITKNEEERLATCLKSIRPHFSDIWVIDSASEDKTADIARGFGARVVNFKWNGRYPKKYGWCLERLEGVADWVLFIDADERMTEGLAQEIKNIDLQGYAGFFIKGRYECQGKILRHGMTNNKLCLLNRHKMKFPHLDDLDIEGMGEVEGHYQPVLRAGFKDQKIGQLKSYLVHATDLLSPSWRDKHERYARWEAKMDARKLWPQENNMARRILKKMFKILPCRAGIAFFHSYILKAGFLDGRGGYDLAYSRYYYYQIIAHYKRLLKNQ
ncbi:MAG: glycosyltransferase family 2 protein [Alphaproteobacteria bacterium]